MFIYTPLAIPYMPVGLLLSSFDSGAIHEHSLHAHASRICPVQLVVSCMQCQSLGATANYLGGANNTATPIETGISKKPICGVLLFFN